MDSKDRELAHLTHGIESQEAGEEYGALLVEEIRAGYGIGNDQAYDSIPATKSELTPSSCNIDTNRCDIRIVSVSPDILEYFKHYRRSRQISPTR